MRWELAYSSFFWSPRLFERFVAIEEGHQAIVQAEIDCVSGSGFWFDTSEINLEMG